MSVYNRHECHFVLGVCKFYFYHRSVAHSGRHNSYCSVSAQSWY